MTDVDVRIGISGWRYRPWRGVFYPPGLPQRRELEYASRRLRTVELNGSFYSLQRPESYLAWAAAVPADFLFAVKGGRFITHMKRLRDVAAPLANFFASGPLALGPLLGPVLWQLPERLGFEPEVVEAFLARLPRSTAEAAALAEQHDERLDGRAWTTTDLDRPLRHALEVRHPGFVDPRFTALARAYGVAVVVADTAGKWPLLLEPTAPLVYVRLHGDTELYVSGYDPPALTLWADRIRGWADEGHDVVVYFDNDVKVRAPFDAMALADLLGVGPPATD
ncbi:DUF72 domain-containing protein [Cellulomonas sp. SG140]|uniref:DUF72 domain-containing protein n=1 Tax=Cellulomonas sp. SG140 TaxID=2976536 RepID=UPI0021E8D91D|nr:DUF72 domain-containing protein [Cellulomonas sp. SG140]